MRIFSLVVVGIVLTGVGASAASAACTRLPLSDVAFGKQAATDAARVKLRSYARSVAVKRGWSLAKPLVKSREAVSCKVYLNLGPFGTEYRCLVTATFCARK